MEALVKESMREPCVIITVPEEAALYGNVRQVSGSVGSKSYRDQYVGVPQEA